MSFYEEKQRNETDLEAKMSQGKDLGGGDGRYSSSLSQTDGNDLVEKGKLPMSQATSWSSQRTGSRDQCGLALAGSMDSPFSHLSQAWLHVRITWGTCLWLLLVKVFIFF